MQSNLFKPLSCAMLMLAFILSGCSLPVIHLATPTPPGLDSGLAPVEPKNSVATIPPTITPAAQTVEVTATPPAAQAASESCVPPGSGTTLAPASFDGYPSGIADYLNAGGTPEDLEAALQAASVASLPQAVSTGDLDGDGMPEVIVSIFDPASTSTPPGGDLLIYHCAAGHYTLAYSLLSSEGAGAARIIELRDLNADGRAELAVSQATCGASTCFENLQILAWTGSAYENRLQGSTQDLPEPEIQFTEDSAAPGLAELVVHAGMFGSVGAGPQRGRTRTWKFNPEEGIWQVTDETVDPSNYRIHVLQDAEDNLRRGEPNTALVIYRWVWTDVPPLDDFLDPPVEKLNLGAYAAYKIVVIQLKAGQGGAGQAVLDQMAAQYPEGTSQAAYVEMARTYQAALAQSGADAACQSVQAYASQHTGGVLDPLGPVAFGYANKTYQPADMCP